MIAYESNNDFSFDTDTFNKVAKAFQKDADNLNTLKDNLITKVNNLQNIGWKSEAGKSFFKIIDENWANDIKRYVDLMNDLATMINYAANQFEEINDQAKLIKYQEDLSALPEISLDKLNPESLRNRY